MPVENLEAESLEKNPNLELAQLKFLLTTPEHQNDKHLKGRLMTAITQNSNVIRHYIYYFMHLLLFVLESFFMHHIMSNFKYFVLNSFLSLNIITMLINVYSRKFA